MRRPLLPILLIAGLAAHWVSAQTVPQPELRLFLDCDRSCDDDFIRTEIGVVDFIRERTDADVHLLITTQRTGSDGRVYTLAFLGRRAFAALSDTLTFTSPGTDSRDDTRRGLTNTIKRGLLPYIARTALADAVEIRFRSREESQADSSAEARDPWNNWVFSIGSNGSARGEESYKSYNLGANLSANRTTERWKVRASLNSRYNEQRFDYDGETTHSSTRNGSIYGTVVRSVDDHWSIGLTTYANTSTRDNTGLSVSGGPAVEYNVFPYSESTRREFRWSYRIRMERVWYDEETLFNLTEESILQHNVEVEFDVRQPWGNLDFAIEATQMLTNFDRSLADSYRLQFDLGMDVRLYRGLSVFLGAQYGRIRDQLFLPLSEVSEEEVLLQTRRLPTGYEFGMHGGLNFRFGSIYNNVVNPRFGN